MDRLTKVSQIVVMVMASSAIFAQSSSLRFEHITEEDGLSGDQVLSILQDRQGYMWFGTTLCLNRYNGYKIDVFRQDYTNIDTTTISNFTIYCLYESSDGYLWIGTYWGLNQYDPATETFIRYYHDPQDANSLSDNNIHAICEDNSGYLWIGTINGLNRFDRSTNTFTRYFHDPLDSTSVSHNEIRAIYRDRVGELWIGAGTLSSDRCGLNRLISEPLTGKKAKNEARSLFKRYDFQPIPNASHDRVRIITEDSSGRLWFTTYGFVCTLDRQTQTLTCFPHDKKDPSSVSSRIYAMCPDDRGNLWIGTYGQGLLRFDTRNEQFHRHVNDPLDPHSLASNVIASIYQDRTGNLWVGTLAASVDKLSTSALNFAHLKRPVQNISDPRYNDIWSINQDRKGNLLVGGAADLSLVTRTPAGADWKPILSSRFGYWVLSCAQDRSGALWIGTKRSGLFRAKLMSETPKTIFAEPEPMELTNPFITTILVDRNDRVWVGTNTGLFRFDRIEGAFREIVLDPLKTDRDDQSIRFLLEDNYGTLWVAAEGLFRHDKDTDRFTRVEQFGGRTIYQDREGMLWCGAFYGLFRMNINDTLAGNLHKTETFRPVDGLAPEGVTSILEDGRGFLWLGTNYSLSRLNPKTKEFTSFFKSDGLAGNWFNERSCFKNDRGEMFFGTNTGLTVFHPDSIRENTHIPSIVLTGFQKMNQETELDTVISHTRQLVLPYDENILSFEFAALDYVNPAKNLYAYRMEGVDQEWVHTDATRRYASYTNLAPGEYVFHVQGSNNDGVWNEEGTSVRIVIEPPPWRTWWAYALYLISLVALLYGWRRYDLARQRLKHQVELEHEHAEKLAEIDQMKSRFFANVSHEFRTPLTLILGPVEQMLSGEFRGNLKEGYRMIVRNGQRLLQLINELLDLSKLESGRLTLSASPIDIVRFLRSLVMSFTSLAERRKITLTFHSGEESIVVFADKEKLEKIILNLLSNAFKFTSEEGRISVSVGLCSKDPGSDSHFAQQESAADKQCVRIRISDTGAGIPAEHLDRIFDRFYQVDETHNQGRSSTGIGLALVKELVEHHHGTITVDSKVGAGSEFTVRLLLGKSHLKPEEIAEDSVTDIERLTAVDTVSLITDEHQLPEADRTAPDEDATIILVVEDNSDVRAYIRQYLEPVFHVIEAVDGQQGLMTATEILPDLIVSDIMMPEMDGYELCRRLKSDERTSHIPVILLTARADGDSKLAGLETGADDYVVKPFDSRELLARAENLITSRRQLRERFSREIVLKPKEVAITPMDEVFLQKVQTIVEAHIDDENFTIANLGREVGMSRSQLHRKLRALSDQSASRFIRSMRLQRAVELLLQKAGTIAEIAYMSGFHSQAYFTTCFHEHFGCTPKEYLTRKS